MKSISISDFSEILDFTPNFKDKEIARFNSEINLTITLYIGVINSDINRKEANSIIDSVNNLEAGARPIVTLPGVLFPGNIVMEKEIENRQVSINLNIPKSVEASGNTTEATPATMSPPA